MVVVPDEQRVARSLIALTAAPVAPVVEGAGDVSAAMESESRYLETLNGLALDGGGAVFDPDSYLSGGQPGVPAGVVGESDGFEDFGAPAAPDGFDPGQYLSGAGTSSGAAPVSERGVPPSGAGSVSAAADVSAGAAPDGFDPGQYLSGAGTSSGAAPAPEPEVPPSVTGGAPAGLDGFDPGQYLSGAGTSSGAAPVPEPGVQPSETGGEGEQVEGSPSPFAVAAEPAPPPPPKKGRWEVQERRVDPETARRMMREFGKLGG